MNENITCTLNSNKINSSINNLIPIYNLVNNSNLIEGIQEVEKEITSINLEHANCVENFKEDIKNLYSKLDILKNDINSLFESLTFSNDRINEKHSFNNNDIKELIDFYNDTSSGQKIQNAFKNISTNISQNLNTLISENNIQQEQPYSTIPIGLGIAASGIAASAGTVLVDSMYQDNTQKTQEIENIDNYNPETKNDELSSNSEVKYEMDEIPTPYHASRDKIIANKFYEGNEDRNEEYEEI